MGAGAAIRDAADLLDQLLEVRAGTKALSVAVSNFEADMRLRGSEVLTLAMKTVDRIVATNTRIGTALTAAGLPILAAGARLRRSR